MPLDDIIAVYQQGGVIAYPTEAVFGLGCDPDNNTAIEKLLQLKQRNKNKGLILIAGNYSQLLPYVDDKAIPQHKRFNVLSRWPGAITQVLPAKTGLSELLTGEFDTIAVRVTEHPFVKAFCQAINKPIISTSANLAGLAAATTWQQVAEQFDHQLDYIVKQPTLGLTKPSQIIDGLSGDILRQ